MTTKTPGLPKIDQPLQKKISKKGHSLVLKPWELIRTKFGNCMAACVKSGSGSRVKLWHDPWVVCLVHVSIFEKSMASAYDLMDVHL